MDDLNEDLKSRILLEERYRTEVRSQLDQASPKEKKNGVTAFLNSSLGLWLLSAVFITGAGSLYTQLHTQSADKSRLKGLHERMKMEVAHRLSVTIVNLSNISEGDDHHQLRPDKTAADVKQILDDFVNGTGSRLSPLYSDLASQSELAMVTELSKQPKENTQALSKAVSDLSGLSVLLEVQGAPPSDAFRVAAVLQTRFNALKFNGDFYFLDCSAGDPFC